MSDIFDEAREQDYGNKQRNFERIAKMWGAFLGIDISPKQVALMMILVKVSRLAHNQTHRDSYIDLIGYAGIGEGLEITE